MTNLLKGGQGRHADELIDNLTWWLRWTLIAAAAWLAIAFLVA